MPHAEGAMPMGTAEGAMPMGTAEGAMPMGTAEGAMLNGVVDVLVNGAPERLSSGATVADVVRRWCPSPDGVAVACNGAVVPRSAWTATAVQAGDRLEIVTAAAGG